MTEEAPYDLALVIDALSAEIGNLRLNLHIERARVKWATDRLAELHVPLGVPVDVAGSGDVLQGDGAHDRTTEGNAEPGVVDGANL